MRLTALPLVVALCSTLLACSDGQDCNSDCIEARLDCNCCSLADSTASAKPTLQKVYIFLETSGSMSGYMPGSTTKATSFQEVVPNIISRLQPHNLSIYSIRESAEAPKPLSSAAAANAIIKGDFGGWGLNTSIPVMLDTINNYQADNSVTVFISDMIYSPEEQKEVSQAITRISEQMGRAGMSATLLCIHSAFQSKFVKTDRSPYYILLQGKPENIQVVKDQIIASTRLYNVSYDEVSFGQPIIQPFYSIIPFAELTGVAEPTSCDSNEESFLIMKNISEGQDSIGFWLGVNLESLPNYSATTAYLKANLFVTGAGVKVLVKDVLTHNDFERKLDDETDKKVAKQCTHFIRINASEFATRTSFITLNIKNIQPEWIGQYNHDNVLQANKVRTETFGLIKLHLAIQDAFRQTDTKQFLKEIKITLLKK